MLWSDPRDDTPQQQRDIRALLRRVWLLIALFATLSLVVVMI
ncbi:morphogenic membrane protein MmpB [Streptacidiphilus monticola]|uniref:Morphogenic membrane protein MmpB n=1 Tax=Streptacidiphilus monticola TaxID=2161674 RepID=A0ABW1G855_9ACTN